MQQPRADQAISEVTSAVRTDGAAAGYAADYHGRKLPHLGTSFLTKLLHFADYPQQARPRPLIYDGLVATAAIRLPGAPLLPSISDGLSAKAYQRYCSWTEPPRQLFDQARHPGMGSLHPRQPAQEGHAAVTARR